MSVRNHTPIAYPGSPLHLSVEFCANPPAYAARWLHGDRVYTPGNQYGIDVLAYGVIVRIHCHIIQTNSAYLIASMQYISLIPYARIFRYRFVKRLDSPLFTCMNVCNVHFTLSSRRPAAWPRLNSMWTSRWNIKVFPIRSTVVTRNFAIPRKYNFQNSGMVVVIVIFIVFLNY